MKFSNFGQFFPTSLGFYNFGLSNVKLSDFSFFHLPFPTTRIPVGHYQKCKNLNFRNRNLLIAISGIYKWTEWIRILEMIIEIIKSHPVNPKRYINP